MAQPFTTLFDPVHGTVDLSDFGGEPYRGVIRGVLSAPMLGRLRRIKQLGHVSYGYVAADHSRFAHALGTMQVARSLIAAATKRVDVPVADFKRRFPEAFRNTPAEPEEVLMEHTLVAALLQDVGELPYEPATGQVFEPDAAVRAHVSEKVGFDVGSWDTKAVFTVASLYEDENERHLDKVDLPLLSFLISGKQYPWEVEEPAMRAWLHMLDGELDADRLDYVYRDAHHTVGGRGTPQAVVETLLRYEPAGPVLSDIGPVVDFLSTRALLWQNVYLSAPNRFRRVLLVLLLREVLSNVVSKQAARELFSVHQVERHLTMDSFKRLDDVWLEARLRELNENPRAKGVLSVRAQRALELLVDARVDYGYLWIPRRPENPPEGAQDHGTEPILAPVGNLTPPAELFYDTYRELYYHWLYEPGSIRVESESLRHLGPAVPIDAYRLFGGLLESGWPAVPMPNAVQVFVPERRKGKDWERFQEHLDAGTLYDELADKDLLREFELPSDTREFDEFSGRAIFVSFRWSDIRTVDEVLRELYRLKRRYLALRSAFQGLGGTPAENSRRAVQEADAVLVVASKAYVERYEQKPPSNITVEVWEMIRRRDDIPFVFLSVDPHRLLNDGLPWEGLGYIRGDAPFIGEPLKGRAPQVIKVGVTEALTYIDQWSPP